MQPCLASNSTKIYFLKVLTVVDIFNKSQGFFPEHPVHVYLLEVGRVGNLAGYQIRVPGLYYPAGSG